MLLASLMFADSYVAEAQALVRADDFYREGHRAVFRAIEDLSAAGEPVEPITVLEQLTKNGEIDMAGGRSGVLDLMESPFIAASYKSYAEIVKDAATQRRLLQVGQEIQKMVVQREGETTTMLQDAESLVFHLTQTGTRGDFRGPRELVIEAMERLTAAEENGLGIVGLPTGFREIDSVLGGLQPGNLIVVAARPSMGKTALTLGIAEHASLRTSKSVGVFSLEMSSDELIQRMLSSAATVDAGRIRRGNIASEDWPRISRAADSISLSKLFIDDSEGVTVPEMRTKARRLKSREGLDLLVVDYIQLMESGRRGRDENRVQEMSAISRGLKMLARDLNVPVVCVSQLNRGPESRENKRPLLSDLRESGAIEQDADVVLLIYRDEYYNEKSEDVGVAEVHIAKNRHGPVSTVRLSFRGNYAKFSDLAKDH